VLDDCARCGRSHKVNNCPAYGKIYCNQCGLKNHFRNKCRKREISDVRPTHCNSNNNNNNHMVAVVLEISRRDWSYGRALRFGHQQ